MIETIIYRGSTPTYEFEFSDQEKEILDRDMLKALSIVFKQQNDFFIKKVYDEVSQDEVTIKDNKISVSLTQEETFSFSPNKMAVFQIKILSQGGQIWLSPEYNAQVKDIIDQELMS